MTSSTGMSLRGSASSESGATPWKTRESSGRDGRPLAADLAQTDLALMLRSTVLLDCLASGIPTLIPGWIDFGWRCSLPDLDGLRIATDFDDLEKTLTAWIDALPVFDAEGKESLVSPPGAHRARFVNLIHGLLDSNQSFKESFPS